MASSFLADGRLGGGVLYGLLGAVRDSVSREATSLWGLSALPSFRAAGRRAFLSHLWQSLPRSPLAISLSPASRPQQLMPRPSAWPRFQGKAQKCGRCRPGGPLPGPARPVPRVVLGTPALTGPLGPQGRLQQPPHLGREPDRPEQGPASPQRHLCQLRRGRGACAATGGCSPDVEEGLHQPLGLEGRGGAEEGELAMALPLPRPPPAGPAAPAPPSGLRISSWHVGHFTSRGHVRKPLPQVGSAS